MHNVQLKQSETHPAIWYVLIDGITIGQGYRRECEALYDELCESEAKCAAALKIVSEEVFA